MKLRFGRRQSALGSTTAPTASALLSEPDQKQPRIQRRNSCAMGALPNPAGTKQQQRQPQPHDDYSPAKTLVDLDDSMDPTELGDSERSEENAASVILDENGQIDLVKMAGDTGTAATPAAVAAAKERQVIDLDEGNFDDYQSDASVGQNTESSASSCTPIREGQTSNQRMSALTRTMASKQSDLSKEFCRMIKKMCKQVQASYNDIEDKDYQVTKKKAIRNVKECREQAEAMATKQSRISHQFETLVNRMEQDALEKDRLNEKLKRQLAAAHAMLKESGVVDLDDISELRTSLHGKSSSHTNKNGPPRTQPPRSARSNRSTPTQATSSMSEIFSIKEISFTSTVVDVAELNATDGPSADDADASDISGDHHLRLLL